MESSKLNLIEIQEKYGDERKTRIEYSGEDFRIEDMIADEDVVITISHMGYIKRTPLANTAGRTGVGEEHRGSRYKRRRLPGTSFYRQYP